MGNGALYMEDEQWLKAKIAKYNILEGRGLWVERNYYCDGVYCYVGTQHLYVNNKIATTEDISKFRTLMEELDK